ncbi:hypothetical protein PV08_10006 [Exophiala spinifera]|uniref:Uncharacterized protein n=1 Tax=Exophiala spinifera TaxID=91928 RepID=A0A0D2B1C5_9EURO|nr:uncharacterized protein PV08_10006 [Exophiala spinifera]KIW12728.1 hypothetical protein PV08_10006 [Exophiala spinifera]
MATYRGSFYFVNKDSSNLTRKDANEAFRISSHVTNKYYQWAKRNRKKYAVNVGESQHRLEAQALQKVHKSQNFIWSAAPVSHVGDECVQLGSGANSSAYGSASPHDSLEHLEQPSSTEEIGRQYLNFQLWPEALSERECRMPKRFDFNPPDWAACPLFRKEALAVFRDWCLSYSCVGIQQANYRQSIDAAWRAKATAFVTDKKSLHGWYSSVLILKALYMQPESFTFLYPMALRHQNRSLMLLRAHVSLYNGDFRANVAHEPVLWEAVERLGGLDALDPDTRAFVILMDNGHSRFTLTRPHLHYTHFDPGSFHSQPELAQYGPLLSNLDSQFRLWDEAFLLPDDALSDDLHNYIMAHREFVAAQALASRLLSEKDQNAADAVFYWLHRRRDSLSSWTMTVYCNIVQTMTPQTPMSRRTRRQLHACICLAVSYAMSFIYGFTLPLEKWLLYIPIQNLRPQIEILLDCMRKRGTLPSAASSGTATSLPTPPVAITHHESLLFLFFVGACAEQLSDGTGKRPELLIDKRWYSTRFAEMTKILRLRTWKESKKVLEMFLYGDGMVLDRFVEGLFELRNELAMSGGML